MTRQVSIIISSYNHGRFIAAAVESALAQTVPVEVIVVDDGSTDDSVQQIRRFGRRVQLVTQPNAGQAAAMNRGLAESRSEVVIFLDSDDLLVRHAAHAASDALRDPSVAKAHWRMTEIDATGRPTGRLVPAQGLSAGNLRDRILCDGPEAYHWPPTSGNAWRRSALARVMPIPPEPFRVCPDVYLAAVAPLLGSIRTVGEPLSCWRRHDRNQTWNDRFEVRLPRFRRQWDLACDALAANCVAAGLPVDADRWRANAWCHRVGGAVERICRVIPPGERFCLIDNAEWGADEAFFDRQCLPFPHRNGRFHGNPADDAAALTELEHARRDGIRHFVLAWPAFWWRGHYPRFTARLLSEGQTRLADDDLNIVALPPAAGMLKTDAPTVSVVIPAYNYGRYIAETLRSVQAQTLADWECIVVDDGSTDDTATVADRLAADDPRIRIIRQVNRGQPAARNAGLAVARGRYVQLLDADDLLEPRKLQRQAAMLDAQPEMDIIYGGCRYFPTDRPDERRYSLAGPDRPWMPCLSGAGREMVAAFLERNIVPINAPLVRRSLFLRVGAFRESLARADDWDFWLRAALCGARFGYSDEAGTLALIRVHGSSLTRRDRRLLPSMLQILENAAAGALPDDLALRARDHLAWLRQVMALARMIDTWVPDAERFILIDDERYRGDLPGYPAVPFTERDGAYAGPPRDDAHASQEIARLRRDGCDFAVIVDHAGWHVQQYPAVRDALRQQARLLAAEPGVGSVYQFDSAHRVIHPVR